MTEEKFIFPDISVITISMDGTKPPHLNLGDITPHTAIAIFESMIESLKELVMPPRITYKDKVIYDVLVYEDDDDDE